MTPLLVNLSLQLEPMSDELQMALPSECLLEFARLREIAMFRKMFGRNAEEQ
jgi:hypothetical protein